VPQEVVCRRTQPGIRKASTITQTIVTSHADDRNAQDELRHGHAGAAE